MYGFELHKCRHCSIFFVLPLVFIFKSFPLLVFSEKLVQNLLLLLLLFLDLCLFVERLNFLSIIAELC